MASLQQIFGWFSRGLFPTQEQYKQTWSSFWHKSERLPQSQVLGLNNALNDKASKEDLANVSSGLIPMGEAINMDDLATKPKVNNHSYYVLDQQDENGNYYIFRYDSALGTWVNTKLISYSGDVVKKSYVGLFTPNPRLAGNLTYNNLRGCANVDVKSIESIDFNSTAGEIHVFILQKVGGYYKYFTEYHVDAIDGNNTLKVGLTYGNWAVMFRHIEGGAQLRFSVDDSAKGYYITSIVPFVDNKSISIPEGEINSTINAAADYNYLVRIKQGLYLDGFDDYNKELFERNAYTYTEKIGLTGAGATPGNPFGAIYVHNVDISGFVSQINIIAPVAGAIELLLLTKDEVAKNYKVDKQTINCVVGDNIIEKNAQFEGRVAVRCKDGKFRYITDDVGHTLSAISLDVALETPDTLDIASVESGSLPNWNISVVVDVQQNKMQNNVVYKVNQLATKTSEIEEKVNNIGYSESKYQKVGNIVYSNFRDSNLPARWINNGFTVTADGLQSPANGGIGTYIEYDQYSNLDSFVTVFRLNMVSASRLLLTNHYKKYLGSAGHVVGFDMINRRLTIYQATAPNTLPSVALKSETIPFNFVAGDTLIRYERNAMLESYTISNGSNSFTMNYDTRTQAASTVGGYDKFGLVFLEGNVIVQAACYSCQLARKPYILVIGDSICNGDTIRALLGGGHLNRWTGILGQKALVSQWALGGNTTGDINRDLDFILSLFEPTIVIYSVGINDSVLSTFIANCQTFINKVEAIGAEPILQTLFPRDGRVQYCTDVSNWVKNSGYRYLDFRKRMTVGGLGVTRRAELFLSDNLHPNVLGHKEQAEEAIITLEL